MAVQEGTPPSAEVEGGEALVAVALREGEWCAKLCFAANGGLRDLRRLQQQLVLVPRKYAGPPLRRVQHPVCEKEQCSVNTHFVSCRCCSEAEVPYLESYASTFSNTRVDGIRPNIICQEGELRGPANLFDQIIYCDGGLTLTRG